jgi:hypothetical protein
MSIVGTTSSETTNGLRVLLPRWSAVANGAVDTANGMAARVNGCTVIAKGAALEEGAVDAATSALG